LLYTLYNSIWNLQKTIVIHCLFKIYCFVLCMTYVKWMHNNIFNFNDVLPKLTLQIVFHVITVELYNKSRIGFASGVLWLKCIFCLSIRSHNCFLWLNHDKMQYLVFFAEILVCFMYVILTMLWTSFCEMFNCLIDLCHVLIHVFLSMCLFMLKQMAYIICQHCKFYVNKCLT